MNYNPALGQHEAGEELETEEALMLNQMMAAQQSHRDSVVTAQRQQARACLSSGGSCAGSHRKPCSYRFGSHSGKPCTYYSGFSSNGDSGNTATHSPERRF